MTTFIKAKLKKSDDQTNIEIGYKYYRLLYHIEIIPKFILIRAIRYRRTNGSNYKKIQFVFYTHVILH